MHSRTLTGERASLPQHLHSSAGAWTVAPIAVQASRDTAACGLQASQSCCPGIVLKDSSEAAEAKGRPKSKEGCGSVTNVSWLVVNAALALCVHRSGHSQAGHLPRPASPHSSGACPPLSWGSLAASYCLTTCLLRVQYSSRQLARPGYHKLLEN